MALTPEITQAGEAASSLAAGAGQMGAESFTVGDILKQKSLDAYKNNQDIIKPLDEATASYVQAPSEARAKYSDPGSENYVFNPFQAENLVSQYTSQQSLPMLMLSSIMGQRFGRIDDTIGAGTRGFQAASAAQQAKAGQAQQNYQNLLGEYQIGQAQQQTDWERPYLERQYEYNLNKPYAGSGGGGGGGGDDFWANLERELQGLDDGGGGQTYDTPPMTGQPGSEQEWPVGSGIFWVANEQGGWD